MTPQDKQLVLETVVEVSTAIARSIVPPNLDFVTLWEDLAVGAQKLDLITTVLNGANRSDAQLDGVALISAALAEVCRQNMARPSQSVLMMVVVLLDEIYEAVAELPEGVTVDNVLLFNKPRRSWAGRDPEDVA